MPNILIIEDEPAMRMGLKDNLEFEGHNIDEAGDGEEGANKILSKSYDLVLLDVMLPKMSGFDVCKTVRAANNNTPIILLTAKGEEIDKVLGLELGADDYVTKPFSVRELMARIKAILRRTPQEAASDQGAEKKLTTIGKLSVDFSSYNAYQDGDEVKMSHKEFEVLQFLHKHQNTLVSRYTLLEEVWGYDEKPTTRTVDNFIVRLRQKIEENPNSPKIIITVHGSGYKLIG